MASAVRCLLIAEEFPALEFMHMRGGIIHRVQPLDSGCSNVNYLVLEGHVRVSN